MLSVILLILKIIGIAVLAIITLVIVIAALILFVPIRYEIKGGGSYGGEDGTEYFAIVRASWLLRIVSFRAELTAEGFGAKVRIFGKKLMGFGREAEKEKPKKNKEKRTKESRKEKNTADEEDPGRKDRGREKETAGPDDDNLKSDETSSESEKDKEAASGTDNGGRSLKKEKRPNIFARFISRIKAFFAGVRHTIAGIFARVRNIGTDIDLILKFFRDEKNKKVIAYVIEKLKKVLRHISPRKLNGRLKLGMSDPASMGNVLALLGIFYPAYGSKFQITPIFEDRLIVEGDLKMRGRIRIFTLLVAFAQVWFDKQFKAFLKRIRQLRESFA